MKPIEELHLNRCNVNVEDDVKSWYMYKAKSMGMNMSQLMAYVLCQWYDQQVNADALRMLAELNKDEDLKQSNQKVIAMLSEMKKIEKNK